MKEHLPFCSLLSRSLFFAISFCLCVAPLTYSLQVICSLSLPISSNFISPSSLLPLLTASSPLSTFPSVPFYLGLFFSLSLSVCVLPLLLTPSRLFALCPYPSHPILFLPLAIFQFHYFSFLLFSPTLSITGSSFLLFSAIFSVLLYSLVSSFCVFSSTSSLIFSVCILPLCFHSYFSS